MLLACVLCLFFVGGSSAEPAKDPLPEFLDLYLYLESSVCERMREQEKEIAALPNATRNEPALQRFLEAMRQEVREGLRKAREEFILGVGEATHNRERKGLRGSQRGDRLPRQAGRDTN